MLTWYAQDHPTSCVAACVRMVLTDFHADWTEAQIRELLGRPRLGITLTATQACLVQAGARVTLHHDWSLDDLREALGRGHYPIVGVERYPLGYPAASHAVVVVRITSRHVQALDSLVGPQPQRYSVRAFELAWRLSGREALVIETPPHRSTS